MRIILVMFALAFIALGIGAWHVIPSKTPVDPEIAAELDRQANATLDARKACRDAVRAQARFPSEVSLWDFLEATAGQIDNGLIGVRGRTELLNGLGLAIPHVFGCDVRGTEVVNLMVRPG